MVFEMKRYLVALLSSKTFYCAQFDYMIISKSEIPSRRMLGCSKRKFGVLKCLSLCPDLYKVQPRERGDRDILATPWANF